LTFDGKRALIKEDKKRTQMTTTTTLTQDVARYWNQCLKVNSSWREFTRELAILNSLDCLHIEDVEFVAELLESNELFEDEDFNELAFACFEFVTELDEVPVDEIDATDLYKLVESGFTEEEVVEKVTEYGVAASVVSDFAEV
jgi:hypothetical protein